MLFFYKNDEMDRRVEEINTKCWSETSREGPLGTPRHRLEDNIKVTLRQAVLSIWSNGRLM
jgi:hypothetical protein